LRAAWELRRSFQNSSSRRLAWMERKARMFSSPGSPPNIASGADHFLAARLDHTGTDEETLTAKGAILHARDVVDEVGQFPFDCGGLGLAQALLSARSDQFLHLVFEQLPSPAPQTGFVVWALLADLRSAAYPFTSTLASCSIVVRKAWVIGLSLPCHRTPSVTGGKSSSGRSRICGLCLTLGMATDKPMP